MDAFKILNQIAPADTSATTLYTCPLRTGTTFDSGNIDVNPNIAGRNIQTIVTSIIVCNSDAGAKTFTMILLPESTTTPAIEHRLFFQNSVGAGETKVLSLGLTLSSDNTIQVVVETANTLSFTAMGIEVS